MTKRSDAVRYLLHNKRDAFFVQASSPASQSASPYGPKKGGTTAAAKAKSKKAAATNVISGKHESATKKRRGRCPKKEKTKLGLV